MLEAAFLLNKSEGMGFDMERIDKENYYLDIAQTVAERDTCLRRNQGAIIVAHDAIISTGYAGAPRGRANCSDLGHCTREKMGIPSGERYELCRSVHAEANAIIAASRESMLGATMYLVRRDAKTNKLIPASPCPMCRRMIINAGISRVIARVTETQYDVINVRDWVYDDDTLPASEEAAIG